MIVELKARFDEANNISWARTLEDVGVHVAYGSAMLKTHAKTVLVVRRDPDGIRRYVPFGEWELQLQDRADVHRCGAVHIESLDWR